MTNLLAWLIALGVAAVALRNGLAFRRGSDRTMLAIYRNRSFPAVYRFYPLLLPYVAGLVIVGAAALVVGQLAAATSTLGGLLITAVLTGAFWGTAVLIWLAVRAPKWLIPDWLAREDVEVGYLHPRLGALDWVSIVAAGLSVVMGFLVLLYVSLGTRAVS